MPISGWIMVGWFLAVILAGVGLLYWGWRSGRIEEWEQARYVPLHEHEPEPWPRGSEEQRGRR